MTVKEVITEIKKLSLEDRLALLEWLTRDLGNERKLVSGADIEEFKADMQALAEKEIPPLPPDFSREDIYSDHD